MGCLAPVSELDDLRTRLMLIGSVPRSSSSLQRLSHLGHLRHPFESFPLHIGLRCIAQMAALRSESLMKNMFVSDEVCQTMSKE